MKFTLGFLLLLATPSSFADCATTLPLKGALNVERCAEPGPNCVYANEAMYKYIAGKKDSNPEVLNLYMHGSPWRLYGADDRITTIEQVAAMVRQQGKAIKRVVLATSWSGMAGKKGGTSLAQQLSKALDGMPVSGQSGFVWYTSDGKMETTRQAFTVVEAGPYNVPKGGKVMASLVLGWFLSAEEHFARERNGEAMLRVGAAADAYLLCPERALKAFEASAAMANPIGAYNAALVRLERGDQGDREAATKLLQQAAAAGDSPAQAALQALERTDGR